MICLKLPPLRHRGGDIEALAEYFRTRFASEFGKNIVGFTHDALEIADEARLAGERPRARRR